QEFPAALRPILLEALRNPAGKHPAAADMVKQHLSNSDNPALKNVGLTHFYLWFGDYDRVADVDDSTQATVVVWDRYPASFRNSPQMKRRLVNEGVVAYWRRHGFPPQCRPVGASDFTCDAINAGAVQ
ncbi:MAG: hypothetical protein M3Q96_07800, partial [Pseudomonadota bacterium]|nr:hypothetical protein [Pseudomonadota bacterium]